MKIQTLRYSIWFICFVVEAHRVVGAFVQKKQRPGDVLAEMQVVCTSDAILLKILTSKPFNGMVYAKDAFSGKNCMSEFTDSTNMTYRLPLKSCGTSFEEVKDGLEYFNTLVVQPHMRLMTNQGKSYHVRCKYLTRERSVSNIHFNVSASFLMSNNLAPVSAPLYATASMPSCSMKIFKSGRDDVADAVKVGDKLIMVIEIDQQDIYGMRVSNCLVRDGTNSIEQQLVDVNGCPTDQLIMQKFDYTNNFTRASVSFLAHKFPHSNSVYYQCNVQLCINGSGGCSEAECINTAVQGGNQRRRKRSLTNKRAVARDIDTVFVPRLESEGASLSKVSPGTSPEISFDIYSGLHVEDPEDYVNMTKDNNYQSEKFEEKSLYQYLSCGGLRNAIIPLATLSVCFTIVLGLVLAHSIRRNQQVNTK